jgi:GT2 family glycosyltransferase
MAAAPFVYIIVLTWNGKEDTLECLRSLQKVTYPNFKVLLVDNASSDGTADVVQNEFPNVEIIINASNLRFAGGNNIGIEKALDQGAEYILLLNNDTVVEEDFLSHLVDAAENNVHVGMVGPKIYFHSDPNRLWYAGGKIEWWKGWISHVGVRENDVGQYNTQSATDYITGCCLIVKREVAKKIGLLDESYFIYGEDADWCLRTARAGYSLLYAPRAIIWHKLSVSAGGHLSWFKNWNKFKSQLRLMIRYARWYHWLIIPFGMIANILTSMYKVKSGEK